MTASVLYDGRISGAAIAAAIGSVSGSHIVAIPNANGMSTLVIRTDH